MKGKISILVSTLALILGLSLAPARAASTPVYLGQTSWTVTLTANTSDPGSVGQSFPVTGGITRLGDNYYQFQGYVSDPNGPFVMSGGGVLVNGQVILSLNTTQNHADSTWRDTGVMQVTLNESDLSGSLYEVGHDFDTGSPGGYDQRYSAGTLTRTGPMIPLTTNSAAATSLLLLQ